jgi:hypothetical protein
MKASELRLIMILGVLTALCMGVVLSQYLLRQQRAIERRQQTLELQQMEGRAMLTEAEMWKQRLDWLQSAQPAMTSENLASEELLEMLLKSATAQGLTVQKQQLHEPVTAAYYREVGVTLTVRGPMASVFRWMHGLLAPAAFRVVSYLKMTPDAANPADVVTMIHISQLHAPAVAQEPSPEAAGS